MSTAYVFNTDAAACVLPNFYFFHLFFFYFGEFCRGEYTCISLYVAGIFGTIGCLWYYLYFFKGFFNNGVILFSSFGNPGWSFYLCAVASGLSLVMSITLIVVGCNMPTSNGAIMPQQPAVITMQNQQQLYPQPPAPPQQHMY